MLNRTETKIPKNEEKKFDIDYFENIKCSYLIFWEKKLIQAQYSCASCSNNSMCKECFDVCHKDCKEKPVIEYPKETGFVCLCGKENKHTVNKILFGHTEKPTMIMKCELKKIDTQINNSKNYRCSTEDLNLCYYCYLTHHYAYCDTDIIEIQEENVNANQNMKCQCKCSFQSKDFISSIIDISTNLELWPNHYLNISIKEGVLDKTLHFLENLIYKLILEDGSFTDDTDLIRFYENCYSLLDVINLRSSFFNEKLKEKLSYKKLAQIINTVNFINEFSEAQYKFLLISIIVFLHVKPDFQKLKSLCFNDFMTSTVLERIYYKELFTSDNIITREINEKYKFNSNDQNSNSDLSLKNAIFKICEILVRKNDYLKTTMEFNHFNPILKLISFLLKRMIFTFDELIKLINYLFELNEIILLDFSKDAFSKFYAEEQSSILNKFAKIYFLIGVNINDLVTLQNFKNCYIYNYSSQNFLQTNELTKDLLKMIIKTSERTTSSYIDTLKPKTTKILTEALKLFYQTDNIYYHQIQSINEFDVREFEMKNEKFKQFENNLNKHIQREEIKNKNSTQTDIFYNDVIELKEEILTNLSDFFNYNKNTNSQPKFKSNDLFKNFLTKCNIKFSLLQYDMTVFKFNELAQNNLTKDAYTESILTIIKQYFPFVTREGFIINIEPLTEVLTYTAIDETIGQLLFLFCNENTPAEDLLDESQLDICLSFLCFFLLSKQGVKYFLTGRIIKKLIEVKLFPLKILRFLQLVIKGVKLYNMDLSNHEILNIFREEITAELDESQFKIVMLLRLKIFGFLSDCFEVEEFELIKNNLFGELNKNIPNFLNTEAFKECVKVKQELISENENLLYNKENEYDKIFPVESKMSLNNNIIIPEYDKDDHDKQKLILNENYDPLKFEEDKMITHNRRIGTSEKSNNNYLINKKKLFINLDVDKNFDNNLITRKLYFTFFEMFSKNTSYVFDKTDELEKLKLIYKFIDLSYIQSILNENYISLNLHERKYLLNFLRAFYFINIYNENYIIDHFRCLSLEDINKIINTNENFDLPSDNNNNYPVETDINSKYNFIKQIQKVAEIFTEEINNIEKILHQKNKEKRKEFVTYLILSVKFISDMFLVDVMTNFVSIAFYKIAQAFIKKSNIIAKFLLENCKEMTIDFEDKIKVLEGIKFSVCDKKKIYSLLADTLNEIFIKTDINREINIKTFLKSYDKGTKLNFNSNEFRDTDYYESFYKETLKASNKEKENNLTSTKNLNKLLKTYINQFSDNPTKLNFISINTNISDMVQRIDYGDMVIRYFINYFNNYEKLQKFDRTQSLLIIICKMLYYDTKQTQYKLKGFIDIANRGKNFFNNFIIIYRKILVLKFANIKNLFNRKKFLEISKIINLMNLFIQLISESFNTVFHSDILGSLSENNSIDDDKFNIHDALAEKGGNLFYYNLTVLKNSVDILIDNSFYGEEHPYDSLIVLVTDIISFMIEYFGSCEKENYKLIELYMNELLPYMSDIFLSEKTSTKGVKTIYRKKILYCIKIQFLDLLISYIQIKRDNAEVEKIRAKLKRTLMFDQILVVFKELLTRMEELKLVNEIFFNINNEEFYHELTDLYKYKTEFRDSLELNLCLKFFIYIKIVNELYQIDPIFNKEKLLKDKNSNKELTKSSDFDYKLFCFFERIVCKVEISKEKTNEYSFFIKPSVAFQLTAETKENFLENVNRNSKFYKLNSLIEETNYFIFEMLCSSNQVENHHMSTFLQSLDFDFLEWGNFLFIILHQILIVINYYHSTDLDNTAYETLEESFKKKVEMNNLVVGVVQIFYLFAILCIWFIYKFPLIYWKNIMYNLNTKKIQFIESEDSKENLIKKILRKTKETKLKPIEVIGEIFNVSNWDKIKIGLFDSIIMNDEINLLFLSLVLVIIYLIIGSPFILAISILFIANLSSTLRSIFLAIKLKWAQLLEVILYTFLIIYLFSWISILWLNKIFFFSGVVDPNSANVK